MLKSALELLPGWGETYVGRVFLLLLIPGRTLWLHSSHLLG